MGSGIKGGGKNQIWIGLEDGQKLMDSLKITEKTCKIYIEVKGKINYQNLCSALEQTGMILQNGYIIGRKPA